MITRVPPAGLNWTERGWRMGKDTPTDELHTLQRPHGDRLERSTASELYPPETRWTGRCGR